MTWVTWRQFRYQGTLAAALLAALAVLLVITGLHAAQVWHSALAGCRKDNSCGGRQPAVRPALAVQQVGNAARNDASSGKPPAARPASRVSSAGAASAGIVPPPRVPPGSAGNRNRLPADDVPNY